MIPTRRLLLIVATLAVAGLVPFWYAPLTWVWLGAAALLVLVALADGMLQRSLGVRVSRGVRPSMSLDTASNVTLSIDNAEQTSRAALQLFDHVPSDMRTDELPLEVDVPPGRSATATYGVRPMARGLKVFGGVDVRRRSPLGLWWRQYAVPLEDKVRVYPNYSTIVKLLAYELDSNLQLAGLRLRQRRGEGIEFHQLRDYRDGDPVRSIDWKASARVSRLIAREYQDERDQQVICLLDTGRRMLAQDADLSHFDHCLNAMLLLCFIALRHGDAAGVLTMGSRQSYLPPSKGGGAINAILNHVYDLQPDRSEMDYVAAATELSVRQRRRSLVVMLTNVREEDSDELRRAVSLLSRRHVVMIASLRERLLDDTLKEPIGDLDDALRYAATQRYLDARRDAQRLLSASGVHIEDCLCDELPAAITNRYLAIKRAGLL